MGSKEKHAGTSGRSRTKLAGRAKEKQTGMVGNARRKADLLSDLREEIVDLRLDGRLINEKIVELYSLQKAGFEARIDLIETVSKLSSRIEELKKLQNQDRDAIKYFNETVSELKRENEKLQNENQQLKKLILDEASLASAFVESKFSALKKGLCDLAINTHDRFEALKK